MKANSTLARLKKIDWSEAAVSLWAISFEGKGEDAPMLVSLIRTTPRLQRKLSLVLLGRVRRAKGLKPYAWESGDLEDDEALVLTSGRDLLKEAVAATNTANSAAAKGTGTAVASVDEILSASGYIIRLDAPSGEVVYGFKKMPESIKTRRCLFEVVFDQLKLDEEKDDSRFRLSESVDAFHFAATSFVVSKKDFEGGLRYREAMITSAKATVALVTKSGVIHNPDALLNGETSLHSMRRLAGIGKNPRFTDPNWLKRVRDLNAKYGWGLHFSPEGRLLLDDNMQLILTLLRDRRAETMIFREIIDADVARVVEASAPPGT